MPTTATTTLSSKGQVVIPEALREALDLRPGTQFVVVGERDVVMLKVIAPPRIGEFGTLVQRARHAAVTTGLRRKEVAAAVRAVRRGR